MKISIFIKLTVISFFFIFTSSASALTASCEFVWENGYPGYKLKGTVTNQEKLTYDQVTVTENLLWISGPFYDNVGQAHHGPLAWNMNQLNSLNEVAITMVNYWELPMYQWGEVSLVNVGFPPFATESCNNYYETFA